jgi:hypothetical protein
MLAIVVLVAITSWVAAATAPRVAATVQRVVVDERTGLAIYGFDPVAYFTENAAAPGREELELPFAGAIWRFRNDGNRAAFAQRPDVYMPQFGGYDPVVLARGVATAGHPGVWLIVGERLYLFHTREARASFAADPQAIMTAAQAKWPAVERNGLP